MKLSQIGLASSLFLSWFSFSSFANTISQDLLFSDTVYIGGISCSDASADAYCETPIPVFSSSGAALNKSEKAVAACVKGGGDCDMVVLATETKSLPQDQILARVFTPSHEQVWIKSKKASFKSMHDLVPPLGNGENEIEFRPDLKFVYLDLALTKKIPVSEISSFPQKASMKIGTESIEYKDITSKELKAKKVIGIQVNLLKFKADLIESDPTEAKKQGSRTKLRTIYFPAFDSKGRINYWFIPDPGC